MNVSAKSYRAQLKEHGVFHTDSRLAQRIREEIGDTSEVYDPTCGVGSLLAVFSDEVQKYGQELEPSYLESAKETLVNFNGCVGDTLSSPGFMDRRFSAIVANPPFSVKWDPKEDARFEDAPCLPPPSKADWAFILHCWYMLTEGGTAAILCFPGALYRGQREGKIREWLVRQNAVEKVVQFEGGYFDDTSISTSLLVLKKGRNGSCTKFVDNSCGIEHTVTFDEIEKNDFNLSVSCYAQPPQVEEEPIDPLTLEMQSRKSMCDRLEADIFISQTVYTIEGWDLNPFLDDLEAVIMKFRM